MDEIMEKPAVLTVKEAAAYLRIGRGHCYEMVREGRIPAIRLGKRLLVPKNPVSRLGREPDRPQRWNSAVPHQPPVGRAAGLLRARGRYLVRHMQQLAAWRLDLQQGHLWGDRGRQQRLPGRQ